ncbi:MAG: EamA family transporter [Gammaproteobacteria bacterium]|nr:MAG: EamA family transporter [Gammaproteobacteria bacterium]RLA22988.1 MAG: EamA family transporter [Gammaproteobacteria bacterium]
MQLTSAYFAVILIWATTPLTVKWGGEGVGFLFGVLLRMLIGTACVAGLLILLRKSLPYHMAALKTYAAGVAGVFGAMMSVYWSAQFIPSGWIAIIFGLTPIITAFLSAIWLKERFVTPLRLAALLLSLFGLSTLYNSAPIDESNYIYGIIGMLTAVLLHSFSSVWIKKIDAKISALSVTAGSLFMSIPLFFASWYFLDGQWPEQIPDRSLYAIIYTGVVATAAGFTIYFYVLGHFSATRVALITLISPLFALWLGHTFNNEVISQGTLFGTALILSGLALFEFDMIRKRVKMLNLRL